MSEVWEALIKIQDRLVEKFEATGTEVFEPGMARFNQPGWINRVWSSDTYRRAHTTWQMKQLSALNVLM